MARDEVCFILSWNRPYFLWSCLYSLFRNTRRDLRFVIIDNGSTDPDVAKIISAFDRMGMFEAVVWGEENDPGRLNKVFDEWRGKLGEFFFFVESDVIVPEGICWANEYARLYRAYPGTGMIGSVSEIDDFVPRERIAELAPDLHEKELRFLSKERSPELRASPNPLLDFDNQHFTNPPGRLILLDTKAMEKTGFTRDLELAILMEDLGYSWKVATRFKHRHLSLINFYFFNQEEKHYTTSLDVRNQFFYDQVDDSMKSGFRRK